MVIHVKAPVLSTEFVTNRTSFYSNPNSTRRARDPFSEVRGMQPASLEAHPCRLGQVHGSAGSWGGVGALSPEPWRPAHLFIFEAVLDWISR